ncbi:SGNH/GDSL hydrolase family protein [Nocardioides hwasunensis]|uniref:SGNH hydrolase-type esterase domain-containing protein n=1 Tax=Nocardioides hwasunensis TaxID=397258 RepID=A0ABR8MJI1_9ACTN|nr:GDSL-type esterase/lipase family protein [Nocardioides hwasunensis]MBD3916198.1 hypothetical protein [Nocardioides hwasunensis]
MSVAAGTVRTVLLGDSHLARLRRQASRLPGEVANRAVGGSSSRDLLAQVSAAGVLATDRVVVSVGSNDAAPWKQVPVAEFAELLSAGLASLPDPRSAVYVAPPGVVEDRLERANDRTNDLMDTYRDAAVRGCEEQGVRVLRADLVVMSLGAAAFAADGLHLSGVGYRALLEELRELL